MPLTCMLSSCDRLEARSRADDGLNHQAWRQQEPYGYPTVVERQPSNTHRHRSVVPVRLCLHGCSAPRAIPSADLFTLVLPTPSAAPLAGRNLSGVHMVLRVSC